ncbi:hypothetical protein ABG768_003947, partial [Culter alburnus]
TRSHIHAASVSLSFPSAPSHEHTHALRHTGTHIDRVAWRINPLTIPVSSPPPYLSLSSSFLTLGGGNLAAPTQLFFSLAEQETLHQASAE